MDFGTILLKLLADPVGGVIIIFIFFPMALCLSLKAMIRWKESTLPYITLTLRTPVRSTALDHEGLCLPTWVNNNQVCIRLDRGVMGFFRRATMILPFVYILHGETFHGKIVRTDEGEYELWTTRYLYGDYYTYSINQLVDGEDVYSKNYSKPQPHLQRLADQGA